MEKYAQSIPPEGRAELYDFAQSFYNVGISDGAFMGLMGTVPKPEKDKQAQYGRYFAKKIAESTITPYSNR